METKTRFLRIASTMLGLIALVHAQLHPAQRVRVSEGYAETLVISKVQPTYPTEARKKHIQGKVVMQAEISKEGTVLTKAATVAVKQWKYKPYLLNGEPFAIETQVSVNFTLATK